MLGWREKDIRRALFMALNEKRQEIKAAQLENILKSPMNIGDMWDQINSSWKKNLYEGLLIILLITTPRQKSIRALEIVLAIFLCFECQFLSFYACYKEYKA